MKKGKKWKRTLSGILCGAMLVNILAVSPGQTVSAAVLPKAGGTESIVVHTNMEEIYVSPDGNDSSQGTIENPLRTIAAARDLVRTMNDDMDKDIVVYLREGVYSQSETLNFTKEDSGTNGHTITYKAYGEETVSISGGEKVTGWEVFDQEKGIYSASFGREVDTRQFYVDGNRATRARSVGGINGCVLDPGAAKGTLGMGTSDIDMVNWKNQSSIEFSFVGAWTLPRCIAEKIEINPNNPNQAIITMTQPCWNDARNKGASSVGSAPRWVENAYELLDEPGEWYLDKTGAIGGEAYTFYYMPFAGENMDTVEAITPVLEEVVHIESDDIEDPVSNLQFQGITFEHGTWLRPHEVGGMSDAQDNNIREARNGGDMATGGNVYLRATQNIVFNSCEFARMGNIALFMHQGNKDNLVVGCHFYDLSAQAIKIGDVRYSDLRNLYLYTDANDPSKNVTMDDWDWRWLQSNNDVINNVIHDTGREFYSAAAISAGVIEESDFIHNEIYNIPYSGFHIGYGWTSWPEMISPMGNNRIQYNYIHDCMLIQKDGGAIYTIGVQACAKGEEGWARKSIISNNYIADQKNLYGSIYLDEGANYYDVYDNVIQNTPEWLLTKHVRNNIHDNYSNSTVMANHASPFEPGSAKLTNNTYFSGDALPEGALAIVAEAGVEKGYEHNHFSCNLSSGKMTLDYDSSKEYQLTAVTANMINVKGDDKIQFTLQSEGLAGKECKLVMKDQVLVGTGDDEGKVCFGEPIAASEIPEISGKSGLTVSVQLPLAGGKSVVTASWEKVTEDETTRLLSESISLYALSDDFSEYDQVLDVDFSKYEKGAVTPDTNPDKISFVENANVKITVEENEEDGRFLKFNKTGNTASSYVGTIPVVPATVGKTFIKYKFRVHQSNAKVYGFGVNTAASGLMGVTWLHEGNRIVHEYGDMQYHDLGKYTVGEWNDVTLILDLDTNTYDAVVNNQLTRENGPISQVIDKQIVNLSFGMYKGHNGSFDVKDIAVYTSRVPQATFVMEDASGDNDLKLKLITSNVKNIPADVKLQYRLTLPESTAGTVAFGDDAVEIINGKAVSSPFEAPKALEETKETIALLPSLETGTHSILAELFYIVEGTEYVLGKQTLSMTVIDSMKTVFKLDLNNYETGAIPEDNPLGLIISGQENGNTVTIEEIDGDKAIKVAKKDSQTTPAVTIPLTASGFIEISVDIKGPEANTIAYTLNLSDEKNTLSQLFHRGGKIWHWNHSGGEVYDGAYDVNAWHNAKMLINPDTKTYDIYINGELRTKDLPWRPDCTGVLTNLTSAFYRLSAAGTYYMKNLTVKASEAPEEESDSFFELDLSDYATGAIPADNPLGLVITGEQNGNAITVEEIDGQKAIKVAKKDGQSSPGLTIPLTASGFVEVSADIKASDTNTIAYTLNLNDEADTLSQIFHRAGKIWHWNHKGGEVYDGTYDVNAWHNAKMLINPETRTYDIYINGELRTANLPWKPGCTGVLTNLSSGFYSKSAAGTYYIKNLIVKPYDPASVEASDAIDMTEVVEQPESSEAVTEEPESSEAVTEEPGSSEAVTEEPESSEAATEEPESSEAVTEEPESSEAATEEPESSEAVTQEPESSEEVTVESISVPAAVKLAAVPAMADKVLYVAKEIGFDAARAEYIRSLRAEGVGEYYIDLVRRMTMEKCCDGEQYKALKIQSDIAIALLKESNPEGLNHIKDFDIDKFEDEQKAELTAALHEELAVLELNLVDAQLVDSEFLNEGTEAYSPALIEARIFDRNTRDLVMTIRNDDIVKNRSLVASVALGDMNATVTEGDEFVLPEEIQAAMDDGSWKNVPVIWDGKADTEKAGTFTFKGYVSEYPEEFTFMLTVNERIEEIKWADKENLQKLADSAEKMDFSQYTDESVKVMKEALANAKTILADATLTADDQKTVDASAEALEKAIAGLVKKSDSNNGGQGDTGNDNNENDSNANDSNANDGNAENPGNPAAPVTGDESSVGMWMLIFMFSVCGTGIVYLRSKSRKRK